MTFSDSAGPSTAFVVPCQRPIYEIDELIEEANFLACTEGLGDNKKWASWGAVGLLQRPGRIIDETFLKLWSKYFRDKLHEKCVVQERYGISEQSSLDNDGSIRIEWPNCVACGGPNDCDALLATLNAPTLVDGIYANPKQIAQACIEAGNARYFMMNVLSGIRTADDHEIWRELRKENPAWIDSGDYNAMAEKLCRNS